MAGRARINLVTVANLAIRESLWLEEILLRRSPANWVILNVGSPKTIVVGFSGKIVELLDVNAVHAQNVPVFRRFTGGGTVLVDENTLFASFIMNAGNVATRAYPREIMEWTEKAIYTPLFDQALRPPHKFSLREHDYVINDKKFGGNAQSITKDRWIHHTSFLWDFHPENMKLLQLPKKRPEYRQDRDHSHFLTTLRTHFPRKEDFHQQMLQQLNTQFDITHVSLPQLLEVTESLMAGVPRDEVIRSKDESMAPFLL